MFPLSAFLCQWTLAGTLRSLWHATIIHIKLSLLMWRKTNYRTELCFSQESERHTIWVKMPNLQLILFNFQDKGYIKLKKTSEFCALDLWRFANIVLVSAAGFFFSFLSLFYFFKEGSYSDVRVTLDNCFSSHRQAVFTPVWANSGGEGFFFLYHTHICTHIYAHMYYMCMHTYMYAHILWFMNVEIKIYPM